MAKPARQKVNHVVCALCGKEFATSAEHEEHQKIVHNTMNKKTSLGEHGGATRDLEPADNKPTTELPPGAENAVKQSGPRNSGATKSKGATN